MISTTSTLPELTVILVLAVSELAPALAFVASPAGTTGEATGGAAAEDNEDGNDEAPPRRASP
jgi:hypothetical protein